MSVLIKDILELMATPSFYEAHKIVPVLCLGYIFTGLYYHFYVGFLLKQKTFYIGIIVGGAAVLNLILNWIFIPSLGIMGAAWGVTMSYFAMSAAAYVLSFRVYPIKYEWGRIFKIGGVAFILYYASKMVTADSIIVSVGIRSSILLGYPAALWIIGFYSHEEIEKIKEKAKSLINRAQKMRLHAISGLDKCFVILRLLLKI
jgi:O-antigen/teichoic acid export membrane protein